MDERVILDDDLTFLTESPHIGTPCLLCDEPIDLGPYGYYSNQVPRVCDDCKQLWKKLKEANND